MARAAILPERYLDPELVARGGMGEVYCATDASLRRPVAIKVLDERLAADETVRKRFDREAHTAARLSGEAGIVTIFDVGECNQRPYIVMEYLRGGSLEDVLRRGGAQPPGAVLRWLEEAARALDHAHTRGVVHRDVKPSNLLLDEQGRVRVADFGVASAAGLDSLTQTGMVIGTAGYLSPEQAQGKPAGPASDRYALAVVSFELLAGERPFQNDNSTAEAAAHVHAPIPALSRRAHGVPPHVDRVFEQALAKDPGDRYTSCSRFVSALRRAFADAEGTTDVLAAPPPTQTTRRRRTGPLALVLLALAGAAAAAIAVATHRGSSPAAVRVTVTGQGTTVVQTVTAERRPSTSASPPAPSAGNAQSLALQGYDKLRAGDYAGALPLLEQAAQQLQGSSTTDEAYNDYNLAYALVKTSGCSAQVLRLLDASEAIQGHRTEIDRLRASCS